MRFDVSATLAGLFSCVSSPSSPFCLLTPGTLCFFKVGKLNLKDNSYALKDELYRHVQRDWPGYLEEEKQLIHRLLIR